MYMIDAFNAVVSILYTYYMYMYKIVVPESLSSLDMFCILLLFLFDCVVAFGLASEAITNM